MALFSKFWEKGNYTICLLILYRILLRNLVFHISLKCVTYWSTPICSHDAQTHWSSRSPDNNRTDDKPRARRTNNWNHHNSKNNNKNRRSNNNNSSYSQNLLYNNDSGSNYNYDQKWSRLKELLFLNVENLLFRFCFIFTFISSTTQLVIWTKYERKIISYNVIVML